MNKFASSFFAFLFLISRAFGANWWHLGLQRNFKHFVTMQPDVAQRFCHKIHFLSDQQKELCSSNEQFLSAISRGVKLGLDECKAQFRMSHWNCTPDANTQLLYGEVMERGSRERAFLHAISSAGIMYAVTKACSTGGLADCGCAARPTETRADFQWGGCSDDVKFGAEFSKQFTDASENARMEQGLVNLHNNDVGRRLLKSNLDLICKCHGVSGSCTVRVCWRKLKPFRVTGDQLLAKYQEAALVKIVQRNNRMRMRPAGRNRRQINSRISRKQLVYLHQSPDYCAQGEFIQGRPCNSTSTGPDGCENLCCGRGYTSQTRMVEDKCNCKFVWCCKVNCEVCSRAREEHFCN